MKPRDLINQYLLRGGIRLSKGSSNQDLAEFLKSVHPVKTEHQLIRMGGPGDGGYLLPNDLNGITTCFSPGVASTAHFEEDLAKLGIRSFLADYSVDRPPVKNPLFFFEKKYLGFKNDQIFTTLTAWTNRNAPSEDEMILQMDIEGAEYDVLLSTPPEVIRRFRILVIEFHNLEELAEKNGFRLVNLTFNKLLADFDILHIHPNNCTQTLSYKGYELPPVMEFTFLRKDRSKNRSPNNNFPHSLDRPNVVGRAEKVLPLCWRSIT